MGISWAQCTYFSFWRYGNHPRLLVEGHMATGLLENCYGMHNRFIDSFCMSNKSNYCNARTCFTNSMVQSPSWEANGCSANFEFYLHSWHPKVNFLFHMCSKIYMPSLRTHGTIPPFPHTLYVQCYKHGDNPKCPLGTSDTNWPIIPAPDERWWWVWSSRWNENWQRKPQCSEDTYPNATLSTTNPALPDLVSNPGRRLSYGTTYLQTINLM
jgi:hypothetical protein